MKKARKIRRQKITEIVGSISFDQLCGHFDEVIKNLNELQSYYKETHADAIEIWIEDNNWADDFIASFDIKIERYENDKEYNTRVKKLMKIKDGEKFEKVKQEQDEYETYLRLQKKFGNKDNLPRLDYDEWKKGWSKP